MSVFYYYETSYTDMAIEDSRVGGISHRFEVADRFFKTVSKVDTALAKKIERDEGHYITLDIAEHYIFDENSVDVLTEEIVGSFDELIAGLKIEKLEKILVVGLGNENMTADSLGPLTVKKFNVQKNPRFCTLTPNVIGVTNIESFDIVSGTAEKIKPDLCIAIDTLVASKTERLNRSFQLTTAGIRPGGGVKNYRPALTHGSLGCPVIAVGVPLVVYALSIVKDFLKMEEARGVVEQQLSELRNLVVTPKEINLTVEYCARILASAIVNIS
jgi:spore protease